MTNKFNGYHDQFPFQASNTFTRVFLPKLTKIKQIAGISFMTQFDTNVQEKE